MMSQVVQGRACSYATHISRNLREPIAAEDRCDKTRGKHFDECSQLIWKACDKCVMVVMAKRKNTHEEVEVCCVHGESEEAAVPREPLMVYD